MFFDDPDDDTPCTCAICKWTGTIKECEKRWFDNGRQAFRMLAGREGWQWHCPNCDHAVHSKWYRVS